MFLSFRLGIQMMKHGNPVQIIFKKWDHFVDIRKDLQKVGHYFKLQKLPVHTGKNMFLSAGSIGADLFFLPLPQLVGLFPVHATRSDLNGPILSAHVWACSFNSQLKTNIIRPQKCPNCLFSISMRLSFFWGFTRHFYSCQYLACQ